MAEREQERLRESSRNSPRRLRIRPVSAPPDTSALSSPLVHLPVDTVTDTLSHTPLSSVRGNDSSSPEQRTLGALHGSDSREQRPKSALRAAAAATTTSPPWTLPRRRLSSSCRVSLWETSPLKPLRGLSDSLARAEQQRFAALQAHSRSRLPRRRAAEGSGPWMQARQSLPRTRVSGSRTRQQPSRAAAHVAPLVQSPYRGGLYEGAQVSALPSCASASARRGKGAGAARAAGGRRQHVAGAGAYEEPLCGLAGRTLANRLGWGGGDGLGGGLLCADGGRMREEQRLNELALRRFQP